MAGSLEEAGAMTKAAGKAGVTLMHLTYLTDSLKIGKMPSSHL